MVTKRVACFLTCGYTEAGAMQSFLKKINGNYEYRQYLPNKTIKKKGDPKALSSQISGLTGEALLEKVYTIIERHAVEIAQCSAVLIEDDLDGRFHGKSDNWIREYIRRIQKKIQSILRCDIPVFVLYASPEIESWFIADWEHGFGYVYTSESYVADLDTAVRCFFVHHLRQYINAYVLREYCDDIENYGYFEQGYYKLSDEIIEAVQNGVKEYISRLPNVNVLYSQQISVSANLYYSKKLHGDRMLRNLNPNILAEKCRQFFMPAFHALEVL